MYDLTLDDAGRPRFLFDVDGQLLGTVKALPPSPWSIRQIGGSYTLVPVCLLLQYVIPNIQTKIRQDRGTQRFFSDQRLDCK